DWRPEPPAEGQPHYVGSQACAACHGAAVRWWRTTMHGRAYATLADQNKNYNLSCVGCHVTGYLRPGGSTVTHVEGLENVGCESCHGPGSQHVADPTGAAVNVVRSPEESTCRGCHNPEHSDRFHFETYRQLMIAPGHGLPPAP
ncbi:MAG TPA: cytochrome c family protein, partial [Sandaracinaceae bacterium]